MKIKLILDLPFSNGPKAGDILETTTPPEGQEKNQRGYKGSIWINGDNGEKCRVLQHEYEIYNDSKDIPAGEL